MKWLVLLALTAVGALAVWAADPPPAGSGSELLERFKQLEGEWIAVNDDAHGHGGMKGKVAAVFRVTAGGSTVIETMFPGTQMEMVSVYHLDGADLVMTHYCMARNQPRFKARAGDVPGSVVFEFTGGANIDPAKDFHIRGGKVTFTGKDALTGEWTAHQAGKKVEPIKIELTRKK